MALAHVQTVMASVSGLISASATLTTTSGNLLVLGLISYAGDFASIDDNKGNTYTLAHGPTMSPGANRGVRQYYCANIVGGASHIITFTLTGIGYLVLFVTEISGALTTGVLDQTAGANQSAGTAPNSGNTATTTQADEILIGTSICEGTTTYTVGAGYTLGAVENDVSGNFMNGAQEWRIVSATGAYAATFVCANASATIIGTYKGLAAAPPAGPRINSLMLTRIGR